MVNKPMGWRKEPARHALAAMGVKTGAQHIPGTTHSSLDAMASKQVGDGKLPNKYWVTVASDYNINRNGVITSVGGAPGGTTDSHTVRVFDTYKEALDYANSIDFDSPVDGIIVRSIIIEDRLSGVLADRIMEVREVTQTEIREDLREETDYTKEEMERRGFKFE